MHVGPPTNPSFKAHSNWERWPREFFRARSHPGTQDGPMTQTPQNPLEACTTASREGPMSFEGVTVNDGVKT